MPAPSTGLVDRWLGEVPRDRFDREFYHRAPLIRRRLAREAVAMLHWDAVQAVMERALPSDLIVAKGGALARGAEPASFDQLRQLFDQGCSIAIRRAEAFHPAFALLAAEFRGAFHGETTIHLFLTPADHHGFGWHYDCEDVFIAQSGGSKEYLLRANTVNPAPTIDAMPDDMHFELETSPAVRCVLQPSDWLYIPSGWWHMANAREDSLSISIGVLSEEAAGRGGSRVAGASRYR